MIEIKHRQVEELIEKAIQKISKDEEYRLVSITNKIENFDALQFFEGAKHIEKSRTFWTNSDKDFYLVGIGQVYEILAEESRFTGTKKAWRDILSKALIYNPYESPGTGIVALGGMAFDPKKEPSAIWSNYKQSHFTIPEFLLSVNKDDCYFTVNIQVRKDDLPTQLANEIERVERILFAHSELEIQDLTIQFKNEIAPFEWKNTVKKATEEICQGKAEKIVLAREIRLKFNERASITSVLRKLLETQPNSYIFAFEKGNDCFIGATPERLVKREKEHLLSTCLAGTAPRGKTAEEDKQIGKELLHDPKNRKEHDFVVQMIKQAMEDYCTDLEVPNNPVIYPLRNLQHLYTPVTATLKQGYSIFDIIENLHPTPALGGTPTEESLAFIREHEHMDRGWYGAPIGWLDSNQNGEFAVAIRSALVQGEEASLFAGCGVVKDSDPEAEYEETNIKFLPMLSVLGGQ
ncbi:isochorismate synthase [Oceanobacillus halophilus]|uniref:Isochorismate synthase MenF n=1 Tax=Oceanobacillus halophilus TaxID=930130 RepID=A0A494ZU98_9BACI|nr:isochorismate synthase [Oceanobacillus halophilus]RKQ29572.1 isochorismate synthase [Oceanobacillus halophilus]